MHSRAPSRDYLPTQIQCTTKTENKHIAGLLLVKQILLLKLFTIEFAPVFPWIIRHSCTTLAVQHCTYFSPLSLAELPAEEGKLYSAGQSTFNKSSVAKHFSMQ